MLKENKKHFLKWIYFLSAIGFFFLKKEEKKHFFQYT